MSVGTGPFARDIRDGLGLCSPGRWPPGKRRVPSTPGLRTLDEAFEAELKHLPVTRMLSELACGKHKGTPFPEAATERIRAKLRVALTAAGHPPASPGPDFQEQPIDVLLLQAALAESGDPDHEVFSSYASGVRIGVGARMPRTPAIYERRNKWRLPSQANPIPEDLDAEPEGAWRANYVSAQLMEKEVEKELESLAENNKALEVPEAQARRVYGNSLVVASLGAVQKKWMTAFVSSASCTTGPTAFQ